MKKIFIAMMAMATFAACATEDTIVTPKGNAIAFGDAFVDNSTKAIYDADNKLDAFTVWGSVNDVALYGTTGATVSTGGDYNTIWTCDQVRYWTPSSTFNFFATAHATVDPNDLVYGIPTELTYTAIAAGDVDLLCSTATVTATTDGAGTPTGNLTTVGEGENAVKNVVGFTMKHLLSRVKVSFESQLEANSDYRYQVTGVKVKSASTGTYTISTSTWSVANDVQKIEMPYTDPNTITNNSTVNCGAKLVIPTSPVDLEFTYELQLKTGEGESDWTTIKSGNVVKSGVIEGNPVQNCSYNITVQLKAGAKIDFTVTSTTAFGDDSNVPVQ